MNAKKFKQLLLDELYQPYINCKRCPLGFLGRKHVVFGEGNPNASLMLVGEAPGADEDIQNRPFIGRSGKLLTRSLQHLNIERPDVFITNIVKCRPPGNRTPTPLESNTCKNLLLLKQINIIRPKIICTLGSAAIRSLLDKDLKITKLRGTLLRWHNITIIPTYHPAYILRNPKELTTFIADLQLAVDNMK
jgi:uracil-DNA glycosylase